MVVIIPLKDFDSNFGALKLGLNFILDHQIFCSIYLVLEEVIAQLKNFDSNLVAANLAFSSIIHFQIISVINLLLV